MFPTFANLAGFWALLAVPALLAIHFLQQRSRPLVTSTWFLIEKLSPRSAGGRTWERLRSSRTLWLQLLAVLAATWVLVEPRWPRAGSAQTVVVVLDASASMTPFRDAARTAAAREFSAADGLAAHTTWIVMTTDVRAPSLYRGPDRAAADAALARWQPALGAHDFAPALHLAHILAGDSGRTLFITDSRAGVPAAERTIGVGHAFDNAGFAGSHVSRDADGLTWRAFVQSHAAAPLRRAWWIETASGRSPAQTVDLPPGALVELTGRFPDAADRCTIVLEPDEFPADDQLPLVRPAAKPLTIAIDGEDAAAGFMRKLALGIDGVSLAPVASATLRFARASDAELATEKRAGVFWPPADSRTSIPLMSEPIAAERHTLVADLNWQGWIGTGPHGYAFARGDVPLLWQAGMALAFLHPLSGDAQQLRLALDWDRTNASRLPATVLLLRRFLEQQRDRQAAPFSANFDAGAPLALADSAAADPRPLTLTFEPAPAGKPETPVTLPAREAALLRAPGRPGFFTLTRGSETILRGATQFADVREADFRDAETFTLNDSVGSRLALERLTRADPFAAAWLLAAAALALASWLRRPGTRMP